MQRSKPKSGRSRALIDERRERGGVHTKLLPVHKGGVFYLLSIDTDTRHLQFNFSCDRHAGVMPAPHLHLGGVEQRVTGDLLNSPVPGAGFEPGTFRSPGEHLIH